MQKQYSIGMDDDRPQKQKTPSVAPTVDSRMHVVTWKRSMNHPIATQPNTDATFTKSTVVADVNGAAERAVRAYVGR